MALHEFDDRARRTGQRRVDGAGAAKNQAPEVHRVQAVRVLGRIDTFQDSVRADATQEQVEAAIDQLNGDPAQSRCLPAT